MLEQDIAKCIRCNLAQTRTRTVLGIGPIPCNIFLLGHSPGVQEDLAGTPFVASAPAGSKLDELLHAAGLTRGQCFVYNTVACHPPNNRDPDATELAACRPFLTRYLQLVKPKIVVLLGQVALSRFESRQKITDCHGLIWYDNGKFFLPTFHPSKVLHEPNLFNVVVHDLKRVHEFI